ncbi:MAG: hypothetical protein WC750_00760 [Patescibacteria group bacterium]|jgi:hypothetical protein
MSLLNSENPKKGRDFEERVSQALEEKFGMKFKKRSFGIGMPPKAHNFDLVSEDGKIIVECKNYSWTETGNVPSAKTAFLNEAVLYLSHVPANSKKIIVLRKDNHSKRKESLAEYYVRTYFHLLNGVVVMELDTNDMTIKEVKLNIA